MLFVANIPYLLRPFRFSSQRSDFFIYTSAKFSHQMIRERTEHKPACGFPSIMTVDTLKLWIYLIVVLWLHTWNKPKNVLNKFLKVQTGNHSSWIIKFKKRIIVLILTIYFLRSFLFQLILHFSSTHLGKR